MPRTLPRVRPLHRHHERTPAPTEERCAVPVRFTGLNRQPAKSRAAVFAHLFIAADHVHVDHRDRAVERNRWGLRVAPRTHERRINARGYADLTDRSDESDPSVTGGRLLSATGD